MFFYDIQRRLSEWYRFRNSLKEYSKYECLTRTIKFWAGAPLVNSFLAYDLPETWPDPWELISDNFYDDVCVSLGIFYTLLYSNVFNKSDIIYNVYDVSDDIITCVTVENTYVLNYDYGNIIKKEDIAVLPRFQYNYNDIIKE